jgi:hypothetical protein
MKRRLLSAAGIVLLGSVAGFAVVALEQATKPKPELPTLLPEGALLSIEARDFASLLHDWNTSEVKRVWLSGDNHAAFITSRLFGRLSQAQDEFSAAAGLPTDDALLEQVAGEESCLGLYDIGNLEFVYVTRIDRQQIEKTSLWQTRGKFEQRTEAGTGFYVRKDADSSRTAAFAAVNGWLILGTREDLVAGVLDRIAGTAAHSLADEGWYADAIKQAAEGEADGARGDLHMVLNLNKIVPSPYFRTYWIQNNITEMKQYTSAVSDLFRSAQSYREERVLVRRAALADTAQGNATALAAMAPEDAAFYVAQATPDPESVLESLRSNLLEMKTERLDSASSIAPAETVAENAGSGSQLDVVIDRAPAAAPHVDAFQPLRILLHAQEPEGSLEVFTTRAVRDGVFVSLQTAMVVSSPHNWDESAVCMALTQALLPGLTTAELGVHWEKRSNGAGDYLALDGAVPLFLKVNEGQMLLSNDADLLEKLIARSKVNATGDKAGVTYMAFFRHAQEQNNFRLLMAQLDLSAHRNGADQQAGSAEEHAPAFFSKNVASLSRAFSKVASERVEEEARSDKVIQTVTYHWSR